MKRLKKYISVLLILAMLLPLTVTGVAASDLPFEDSEFFQIGDYSIHYRYKSGLGEFKGRFIMIHGLVSSTVSWENMAELLTAEGYDCLLVDLPNFGYSTRENVNVEAIPREDIIAALMEEKAPGEKWYVAGHSMGGWVALTIAIKHPELVDALFLYAPGAVTKAMFPSQSEASLQIMGKIFDGFFSALIRFVSIPFINRMVKDYLDYPADYDLNRRYLDALRIENTGLGLLFMAKRATPLDMELVNQLEMPIFLCLAENDKVVKIDSEFSLELQENLPEQAVKLVMPGLNHLFIENEAQEVTDETLSFIAGLS
ncbi:MAG: alpha/beta hydrolase [Clostridiales bacterium]|jgi:pimeloyl-ACP methyl ester carboxylesterase|nr:alpha/beta hydrolase [Clostridiales bacterium]